MFQGSIVALITPMNEEGSIDKESLRELIEWHIAEKTDALVVAGTTGESATLTPSEQIELISWVVKHVAKRIPVIAGTGSNATHHAIQLTQLAKEAGVDACLLVTPYYNKPPQNGLYEHYKAVAEKTAIPIILYNVPGRTACDLLPETVERLALLPQIVGIKEATGNIARTDEILRRCRKGFEVYSGDDATGMDLLFHGAKGIISVTANIAPRKMHEMCQAALTGNQSLAEKINAELLPLHQKLFLEANPIPAKWALYEMGKVPPGIRLPLLPLDTRYRTELQEAMRAAGIEKSAHIK